MHLDVLLETGQAIGDPNAYGLRSAGTSCSWGPLLRRRLREEVLRLRRLLIALPILACGCASQPEALYLQAQRHALSEATLECRTHMFRAHLHLRYYGGFDVPDAYCRAYARARALGWRGPLCTLDH